MWALGRWVEHNPHAVEHARVAGITLSRIKEVVRQGSPRALSYVGGLRQCTTALTRWASLMSLHLVDSEAAVRTVSQMDEFVGRRGVYVCVCERPKFGGRREEGALCQECRRPLPFAKLRARGHDQLDAQGRCSAHRLPSICMQRCGQRWGCQCPGKVQMRCLCPGEPLAPTSRCMTCSRTLHNMCHVPPIRGHQLRRFQCDWCWSRIFADSSLQFAPPSVAQAHRPAGAESHQRVALFDDTDEDDEAESGSAGDAGQ